MKVIASLLHVTLREYFQVLVGVQTSGQVAIHLVIKKHPRKSPREFE